MLFNSIEYPIYLLVVFFLYWFVFKGLRAQNFLILLVSYVFYGWWDYRFLSLIFFSSLVDYVVSLKLDSTDSSRIRKYWLALSMTVNLGLLGFFKYYNFFVDSWIHAWSTFGISMDVSTVQVILPVGISFYTFQTMSYTIDVYRKELKAERDPVAFFAFVSLFPQLVAGPIERATELLPQINKKREFRYDQAADGMAQIMWGLLKKVVIADNCAVMANKIFAEYETLPSHILLLGAIYFAFQIYGDFSGYSDIAIGSAKLFGFRLMRNFNYPYFSRNIGEFWRRWHISLNTWFRDYLYIPLGGSKGSMFNKLRNTSLVFLVSGFWHGANWTFILWGAINALYFYPLLISGKNRSHLDTAAQDRYLPNLTELYGILSTFLLTCLAWVFFRAANVTEAFGYLTGIFSFDFFYVDGYTKYVPYVLVFVMIEWMGRLKDYPTKFSSDTPWYVRWTVNVGLIAVFLLFANASDDLSFIYFQF